MAYNIDFLRNVSSSGPGAIHRTDGFDLAIVQVSGNFDSVRITLEGRLAEEESTWERIGIFWIGEPSNTLSSISKSGIYECPIFGLAEIRFTVQAIDGGSVTVEGVFYDTANENTYPYDEMEGVKMIQMGGSNLFVKGVAEQIFMDPTTGNIVGYDRTATNASVATQVNLQEVIGGMGNRLVGVLPDTVRINGTYESAAFSMETREKIMGGSIAYDAVASVCEKITADDSEELTVSKDPSPFYGEGTVDIPVYKTISDVTVADFMSETSAPLKNLVVDMGPIQAGAGTPDPLNIRAISTRTSVDIHVSPTTDPADGNIYSVPFPSEAGPLYGGILDFPARKLTANRKYIAFDGSENWRKYTASIESRNWFYLKIEDFGDVIDQSGTCSHFPPAIINSYTNESGQYIYNSSAGTAEARVYIRHPDLIDLTLAEFKTWLADQSAAGTPVQIVYALATPMAEYAINVPSVATIPDFNNVWADFGKIQTLEYLAGYEPPDGTVYRAYVRESGVSGYTGEAYGVDAKTRKVVGFVPEEGKTYEVTYYTHNASASMLPIPTMWNPVVMTVQVKYGVYAKQGVGDKENRGVLKGWLYFIVPRAILTADAGVNASQTGTATTDGSWMALTNKAENLPMCADCDGSSDPMAYYVYVPCGDTNESVVAILSVGGGMVLSPGQKKQLPIKLLMPDDTLAQPDFTTLNYLSDDDAVATVNTNGEVTGVGTGTTIINTSLALADGTVLSCKTMVVVA